MYFQCTRKYTNVILVYTDLERFKFIKVYCKVHFKFAKVHLQVYNMYITLHTTKKPHEE